MELLNEIMPFLKAHPILSMAWVGLFIAIIYLTIKARFSKVKSITNSQVVHLMNTKNAVIIDIRPNDSFKRGHITTAYNILPTDIKNGSFKTIDRFKTQPVVVVCESGLTAASSAEHLVKAGFADVYCLKDGVTGWNSDNLPLVKK